MLGSLYIEHFIRRIGHIRAFAIFASMNSAAIIAQSLVLDIPTWTCLRFAIGVCAAGLFVVIESWLLLLSTIQTRGKLLSLYGRHLRLTRSRPIHSQPHALGKPRPLCHIRAPLLSLCHPRLRDEKRRPQYSEDTSVMTIFHIAKKCPFGVTGCLLAGMILSAFYSLGPVFAEKTLGSISQVSAFMGYTILGGLVLQWPLGHLSDIFDRLKMVLLVAMILVCITTALFFSLPYTYLIALSILFGGFSFTLYPLSITFTSDHFHSSKIVSVTSALYAVYGFGSIIGPLVSPLFMYMTRPSGLFLYDTLLTVCLIVFGFCNSLRKSRRLKSNNRANTSHCQERHLSLFI